MIPRAAGLRRPDRRGARHRLLRRARRSSPCTRRRPARRARAASSVEFTYPGAEAPVLARPHLHAPSPGRPSAIIGSHRRRQDARWSTWCPGCSTPPPGSGARRRRRRTRPRARPALVAGSGWCRSRRTCSPARCASNLRHGKPDATDERALAGAGDRPGRDFVEAMPRGPRRTDRPGRHQRLRRPAAAARASRGRVVRRPRSTCSTTRSRRSTSPPTPGCGPRCDRSPATPPSSSSRSGSPRSATPT